MNTIEEVKGDVCLTCGQSLISKYAMSRGLRNTLQAMSQFIKNKGFNVAHIQKELVAEGYITPNQLKNLETHGIRLGVVARVENEPANYRITSRGFAFLNGEAIPKYAHASKRTKAKRTRTIEFSEETCTARDFDKKGEYWEVPGFEIREGRVILPGSSEVHRI